jgi:lipopolysaccharide/colanic/teichoic acid biosynthesis glycosyltransferase
MRVTWEGLARERGRNAGRVGQGGRLFNLYRFRTMVDDAEKHVGPVWVTKDDERITPVGCLLRQMRIDELPQLFNVLRGDMSLVGLRPERPFFVQRHQTLQGARLAVKPGPDGLDPGPQLLRSQA